ncbi:MAG: protein kinase [Pyrinomonadaceae bacterium]
MNYAELVGRTLDEKYQIERELGRGGMGTVYLATHLGTERPVAIKVISPQYMKRPEFVERFRREARAAGRLRHPNVVNVTDFGFAATDEGRVAYLVMEYLDGCTLGEILEEEKNLPVGWTLDILEQVCSAVHEAHEQGIIHRDLKPDNIWLEPNQRGGYTVKVLDFGIAKLETAESNDIGDQAREVRSAPITLSGVNQTLANQPYDETVHDSAPHTAIGEIAATTILPDTVSDKETLIQRVSEGDEAGTLAMPSDIDEESVGTRLISDASSWNGGESAGESGRPSFGAGSSADLTRVGSVLGTPLYMSPEQCRGDKLDPRSDIYSIGVIAYQMLAGDTPFSGDFTRVMESHKYIPPPPFEAKNVRKKLKRTILSALAKDPDGRPHSAEAFANALRSRSEGIFGLLRRAGMIYTEHIQKFLYLSVFFFLPIVAITAVLVVFNFLKASEIIPGTVANIVMGLGGIMNLVMAVFCSFLILGTIAWIVTQSLAVPLRPIKLRAALTEAGKKWKRFAGLGIVSTLIPLFASGIAFVAVFGVMLVVFWLIFRTFDGAVLIVPLVLGSLAAVAAFVVPSVWLMLVAPVAMMEDIGGLRSLKRSKALVSRSFVTALSAYIIMFMIPAVAAFSLNFVITTTAKAFDTRPSVVESRQAGGNFRVEKNAASGEQGGDRSYDVSIGTGRGVSIRSSGKDMRSRFVDPLLESLMQILLLPIQIVVISFTSIIVALLYLKTRQAGGESLNELLANFEEADKPRKKWQERVRQRLIQSGRITSRS